MCLKEDPEERPSITELLENPIFDEVRGCESNYNMETWKQEYDGKIQSRQVNNVEAQFEHCDL